MSHECGSFLQLSKHGPHYYINYVEKTRIFSIKCGISRDSRVLLKIYMPQDLFSIKISFESLYFCIDPLALFSLFSNVCQEFLFLSVRLEINENKANGLMQKKYIYNDWKKNLWRRNFATCKFLIKCMSRAILRI